MNQIFKYNGNTKYSTKDLNSGYTVYNFSVLDVYLNGKWPSVKIHLLNFFRDHYIVAWAGPTVIGYDRWSLSDAHWMKFYNDHGKYRPKLSEYFQMYWSQPNFTMFCVTGALGISWQHLNHPNLLERSVYRFHVYFHEQIMLYHSGISLSHEDAFCKG